MVTAGSLNLPEPDETESTFVGNALLKARHAADLSGEVALAEQTFKACQHASRQVVLLLKELQRGLPRGRGAAQPRTGSEARG